MQLFLKKYVFIYKGDYGKSQYREKKWKILMNNEDSEECVNDTWLTAWDTIPPKRPSILSSFLGRITRNFSIDKLRKKYAAKRPDIHMINMENKW